MKVGGGAKKAHRVKNVLLVGLALLTVLAGTAYWLVDSYKFEIYDAEIASQIEALGLQKKTVQAGGFSWAYLENSSRHQKPTLVMIHGFGATKEAWLQFAAYLHKDFHLVIVDLPGHGESSFDNNKQYGLDDQTQYVHAFIEAIALDRFHLTGNSMGGGITGLYTATQPDKVISAVLIDPAGIVDHRSDYQAYLDRGENPLLIQTVADLDFLYEYAVAEKITIPWPINEVLLAKAMEMRPNLQHIFIDVTTALEYDYKGAIAAIESPMMVIWGTEDRIISPKNAAEYQSLNPDIEVKLLDNVGHIPMVEVPDKTAKIIAQFASSASVPSS
ncbi:MAG: alpha/beta hydrolase [Pseudomonadales bacterium]|nr:alpha/beta hydrolase [Pseudomonadales bacterium]